MEWRCERITSEAKGSSRTETKLVGMRNVSDTIIRTKMIQGPASEANLIATTDKIKNCAGAGRTARSKSALSFKSRMEHMNEECRAVVVSAGAVRYPLRFCDSGVCHAAHSLSHNHAFLSMTQEVTSYMRQKDVQHAPRVDRCC